MIVKKIKLGSNGQVEGIPSEITVRALKGKELSLIFTSLTEASIDTVIKAIVEEDIDIGLLPDEDRFQILLTAKEITFGPEIKQQFLCPYCNHTFEHTMLVDDLEFTSLEKELFTKEHELSNGDKIKLRLPNKSIWQQIEKARNTLNYTFDYDYLFLLASKIKIVNSKELSITGVIDYLENLPGKYFREISDLTKFKFGYTKTYEIECEKCNNTFLGGIGVNADLFR